MSIKSQKSLNEECSEIFERSYSVKSISEDSLSCEDEEECLARDLIQKMTPVVLNKLRRYFKKGKEKNLDKDIDRRVEEVMRVAAAEEGIEFAASWRPAPGPGDELCLDEQGFVGALDAIFGHHKYTVHSHMLFQVLDPFKVGRVWWRQLVARVEAQGARKTRSRGEGWQPAKVTRIKRLDHCKRECITKMVNIEREDSFCYVAVSKGGRVGIYDGLFNFLHSYQVFYHRTGIQRRVKNCWITDAIYLTDVQCLVLSASDRSLTVYDAATLIHTPLYCITGLPNIPTCLAYSPTSHPGGSSELMMGTERGDIIRVRFLQPKVSLFYNKTSESISYYFWMELSSYPHTSYCSIITWRRVHSRSVRRLTYIRGGDIALSCSHDTTVSLRWRYVSGKMDDYVFKVQRGVTCFHCVPSMDAVVTGSAGGAVRVYGRAVRGGTTLRGVRGAVRDVALAAALHLVLAYCGDCSLHIWDLNEECLLQTIKIRFPFLGVLGKKVEFGTFSIYPGPVRREAVEDEPGVPTSSRRGSSVYRGSTGGLMLQSEPSEGRQSAGGERDPEYLRFSRAELVVTCCAHTAAVQLTSTAGAVPPPPAESLRVRRPSLWDLSQDFFAVSQLTPPRATSRSSSPIPSSSSQFLTPATAEHPTQDLDDLLEQAGLQGILEKDFVLMQGLKHDLNQRITDMRTNMDSMVCAVKAGAPYLALKMHDVSTLVPGDEFSDTYARINSMIQATPTASEGSTPRGTGSSQRL